MVGVGTSRSKGSTSLRLSGSARPSSSNPRGYWEPAQEHLIFGNTSASMNQSFISFLTCSFLRPALFWLRSTVEVRICVESISILGGSSCRAWRARCLVALVLSEGCRKSRFIPWVRGQTISCSDRLFKKTANQEPPQEHWMVLA